MALLFEDDGKFFTDEKSLNAYRAAEKRKRDELSHANYMRDLGREEGIKEGMKEGIEKVALNMLNAGDPIDRISILTGMSAGDILKLQNA